MANDRPSTEAAARLKIVLPGILENSYVCWRKSEAKDRKTPGPTGTFKKVKYQ
jgi:hypothetical protein